MMLPNPRVLPPLPHVGVVHDPTEKRIRVQLEPTEWETDIESVAEVLQPTVAKFIDRKFTPAELGAVRVEILQALRAEMERGTITRSAMGKWLVKGESRLVVTRTFPIQPEPGCPFPTMVPWSLADEAFSQYKAFTGDPSSLQRIADRGGFHVTEFALLLDGKQPLNRALPNMHEIIEKAWRRVAAVTSEIGRLEQDNAKLRKQLEETQKRADTIEKSRPILLSSTKGQHVTIEEPDGTSVILENAWISAFKRAKSLRGSGEIDLTLVFDAADTVRL